MFPLVLHHNSLSYAMLYHANVLRPVIRFQAKYEPLNPPHNSDDCRPCNPLSSLYILRPACHHRFLIPGNSGESGEI